MPAPRQILTVADVDRFVRDRCFAPAPPGRVGLELEWLVLDPEHPGRPVPLATVEAAVAAAGPLPEASRVTYEPGGQLELSTPPRPGVAAACAAADADVAAARRALDRVGLDLVGVGLDPLRHVRRVVDAPRYRAMEAYFDAQGPEGHRMMCETAAIQVNVEAGRADDVAARWALALALGPVLAAAFAHSPFVQGMPSGLASNRLATWTAIDPTRTVPPAGGDDPARTWARYALDAHVMLMRMTPDRYLPVTHALPFARWMAEGHEAGWPTLDDLEYHLTTLFPPVRPRGWLELRMLDALPHPWWRVAAAVTVALLDDDEAADAAAHAVAPVATAWDSATRGLADPLLAAAARRCFALAVDALPRVGADPATVDLTVAYRERFVDRGRCPADDLVDAWHRTGSVVPVPPPREPMWT